MAAQPTAAIIGVGKIAASHLSALRAAGFSVRHVAASPGSKNVQKFAELHGIESYWHDPRELLLDGDWDAVVLATSVEPTIDLLTIANEIGKPCLVEKPIAYDSAVLRQLLHSSLHIRVGYNRRFYDTSCLAREFAKLGPCIFQLELPDSGNFRNKDGIKSIRHNSIHGLDLLAFVIGQYRIEKVFSMGDDSSPGFVAALKNGLGHMGVIVINFNCSANYRLVLDRAPKRFELNPLEFSRSYEEVEVVAPSIELPFRQYLPKVVSHADWGNKNDGLKPGFLSQAQSLMNFTINGVWDDRAATIQDAMFALDTADTFESRLTIS